MYVEIIRKFGGLVLWGALCALAAGLAVWLALTNYQSLVSALELWGTEKKGIADDELLGQVLGPLSSTIADASLAHGFAFAMAAGIGGALFLLCRTLFDVWNARDERAEYRRVGNTDGEHNVGISIRRRAREAVVILLPLAGAIWLDIELFKYRALNAAAGVDDAAEATAGTLYWAAVPPEAMQNYAVNLSLLGGPIGYIALTALVSFMLEIALQRFNETFSVLGMLIGRVLNDETGEQPGELGTREEPLEEPRTAAPAEGVDEADDGTSAVPERITVIGSVDEAITLAQALADPGRYHVEIATRSVWRRSHWEALHGVNQPELSKEAA